MWLDVLQVAGVVMLAVTMLSVAGYVLSFWGFRLTRHLRGTLQVSRGLLTTRATSIEERRLRGVDRFEPLLLRWFGGARLQCHRDRPAHRGSESGSAVLVPPAPVATVTAVEAAVLGNTRIGAVALIPHGPAARRRRYTRALGVTSVLIAVLLGIVDGVGWLVVPAWLLVAAVAGGRSAGSRPLSESGTRPDRRSPGHPGRVAGPASQCVGRFRGDRADAAAVVLPAAQRVDQPDRHHSGRRPAVRGPGSAGHAPRSISPSAGPAEPATFRAGDRRRPVARRPGVSRLPDSDWEPARRHVPGIAAVAVRCDRTTAAVTTAGRRQVATPDQRWPTA